jgi:hypothetical protein
VNIVIKKSGDWAKYIAFGEFHFGSSEQESGCPLRITAIIMLAGILMQNLEHMGVKPVVFRARYTDSALTIMG